MRFKTDVSASLPSSSLPLESFVCFNSVSLDFLLKFQTCGKVETIVHSVPKYPTPRITSR